MLHINLLKTCTIGTTIIKANEHNPKKEQFVVFIFNELKAYLIGCLCNFNIGVKHSLNFKKLIYSNLIKLTM